ncbi:polysaccharide pyruvyl transferase family protein [Candidatus Peregrinibacteria bacterium]|nr:polysaccharide pyruvyl transferase family protein [Candidatus Peregrinibacteria bacterium]
MRYLLIGNYGVGNLGDEALRGYFLDAFPAAPCSDAKASTTGEVEWVVVSTDVPRLPLGARSFFGTPWWKTVRAYVKSDGIVFGGGSLFTDSESIKAPLLWWWHAVVAWVFRKPIFLAFQGVGPFRTTLGEWLTRWVVQHATFVSVRDRASFDRVRQWRSDIVLTFDPVLISLSSAEYPPHWGGMKGGGGDLFDPLSLSLSPREREMLVVIPRSNSGAVFIDRALAIYNQQSFDHVLILSLQPNCSCEKAVCKKIQEHIPPAQILSVHSLSEFSHIMVSASFILSQRYHGALAALALGVPFETMAQAEGDKLSMLKNTSKEEALKLVQDGEHALRLVLLRRASQNI